MAAIFNGVMLEDIETMLSDVNWSFRREAKERDLCCLSSTSNGYVFLIFLQDRLQGGRFGTVTFVAQFDSSRPLDTVNDWNREMKYTKVYLSNEGKVRLEMDVSAEGLTKQLFLDSLKIYERSLRQL